MSHICVSNILPARTRSGMLRKNQPSPAPVQPAPVQPAPVQPVQPAQPAQPVPAPAQPNSRNHSKKTPEKRKDIVSELKEKAISLYDRQRRYFLYIYDDSAENKEEKIKLISDYESLISKINIVLTFPILVKERVILTFWKNRISEFHNLDLGFGKS